MDTKRQVGRKRHLANRRYPVGLYPSKGQLFFRDGDGKWTRVCRLEEWGTKETHDRYNGLAAGAKEAAGTVALLLQGELEHRWESVREGTLSQRTAHDNEDEARFLNLVFGRFQVDEVNSRQVATYLQKRSYQPKARRGPDGELVQDKPRRATVRANREISLLSAAYARGLTLEAWPQIKFNPCTGVRRNKETPKERCPEVWEIEEAKKKAIPKKLYDEKGRFIATQRVVWAYIFDLAYICGQRGVQTRMLKKADIRLDGIFVGKKKNGENVFIEWNDDLIAVVMGLLEYTAEVERRLHVVSPYIIATRKGQPYSAAGWKNAVYRIVRAAIADPDNKLEMPFSFHDIRARSGTDEEDIFKTSPQHRLGHKKRSTTEIYLRSKITRRVRPLPLRKLGS